MKKAIILVFLALVSVMISTAAVSAEEIISYVEGLPYVDFASIKAGACGIYCNLNFELDCGYTVDEIGVTYYDKNQNTWKFYSCRIEKPANKGSYDVYIPYDSIEAKKKYKFNSYCVIGERNQIVIGDKKRNYKKGQNMRPYFTISTMSYENNKLNATVRVDTPGNSPIKTVHLLCGTEKYPFQDRIEFNKTEKKYSASLVSEQIAGYSGGDFALDLDMPSENLYTWYVIVVSNTNKTTISRVYKIRGGKLILGSWRDVIKTLIAFLIRLLFTGGIIKWTVNARKSRKRA